MPKYELEATVSQPLKKAVKTRVKAIVENQGDLVHHEKNDATHLDYDGDESIIKPIRLRPFGKFRNRAKQLRSVIVNVSTIPSEQIDINVKIQRIVEAILFVAKQPMTAKQILLTFPELEQPTLPEVQGAIEAIAEEYKYRPIELKQVASGYRFQIKQDLSHWVSRLFEEKPPKYSRALLETLAIIAYRQPVTRADIEDIRGVSVSSSIIQTLLEREWVRVVGHKETPGRPGLYGTTKQFLDYFNMTALNELPTLEEIKHLEGAIDSTKQPMQVMSEQQDTA
ncbi:MAG: SMC-Scp complex subunit ScpB [Methylococcales bacterium]|nr:SMC-Scp complex subunit ScpB [Methylococcales bacterium]